MTFDQIMNEYNNDVYIPENNILEKALMIPALKAKWVGIHMQHKKELADLEKQLKAIKYEHQSILTGKSKISFTPHELEKLKIDASNDTKIIDERIKELNIKIECLEHLLQCILFIGNDIKNIIDYKKMIGE